MSNQTSTPTAYLRRDLTTLLVLGAILAAGLAALWYLEQHGAGFSRLAANLLDAATH